MNLKVLIVEDDRDIVDLIEYNLKKEGYTTAYTLTGKEAVSLAKKNLPNLIILVLMLPDIDGFEICKQLKKDPPVIVLSS